MAPIEFDKAKPKPDVVRTPTLQRWRSALARATTPDAAERVEVMLAALAELTQGRHVGVRFDTQTGLVRTLRGDFFPGVANSAPAMLEMAGSFVQAYQKALVGSETHWQPDDTPDDEDGSGLGHEPLIGHAVRFRQTTPQGIPVNGAKLIAGFNDEQRLTLCHSSWLPLPADYEPPEDVWGDAQEAAERAAIHIAGRVDTDGLVARPAPGTLAGRVLLQEYYMPEEARGRWQEFVRRAMAQGIDYGFDWVPAWQFWVTAPSIARTWRVRFVPPIDYLYDIEFAIHAPLDFCVYETNQAALNNTKTLVRLDIPNGPPLAQASDFRLSGDQFAEPGPCGGAIDNRLRTGNVYYHLRRTRDAFGKTIVPNGWPAGLARNFAIPGDGNTMNVHLTLLLAGGEYDLGTGSLNLGAVIGGAAPVGDVAVDRDVILHEYAHSLQHRVQPDLHEAPSAFGRAIDEGLAFYFACSLNQPAVTTGQVRWGEAAYKDNDWTGLAFRDVQRGSIASQRVNFDFLQVHNIFPRYTANPDPAGDEYACGMALARTLWDLRRTLGPGVVDAVTLRALNVTGGWQSELESLAEAFIHYELERAAAAHHESLARLVFCSRGVAADAAIHDFHTLRWNNTDVVLAATEGGATSSCCISTDGGQTWASLGSGAADETVALASVDLGVAGAVLFAAGEVWDNAAGTTSNRVFRYPLAPGALDTGAAWVALRQLPDPANNLLCLLAVPAAVAGTYWLFAGSEQGLLRYRSDTDQWDTVAAVPNFERVFDLLITGNPRRVIACGEGTTYLLDPANTAAPLWTMPQGNNAGANRFTLAAGSTTSPDEVVIGTAFEGIYQLNVVTQALTQDRTLNRPVFSLWAGSETIQGVQTPVVYAGTNDGVFRRAGNAAWSSLNPAAGTSAAESPANTTVVALAQAGNHLLAATTERGLWAYEPATTTWTRSTTGLPRTGRLVDLPVPASLNGWSAVLSAPAVLDNGASASHVFYLPKGASNQRLRLMPNTVQVALALYFVSPYTNIDLAVMNWAGVQPIILDALPGVALRARTRINEGFYVLVVQARAQQVSYQVNVSIEVV